MRRRVRLLTPANRDVVRLVDFLIDKDPRAAMRAEFSERGRLGPGPNLRELVVPFGSAAYVIQYLVEPDTVIVTRIGREDR